MFSLKRCSHPFVAIMLATTTLCACSSTEDNVDGCGSYLYGYDPLKRYVSDESLAPYERMQFQGATNRFALSESALIDGLLTAIDNAPERPSKTFNILILSGGGQWGAYGAGFLNGWADSKRVMAGTEYPSREDIDILTGVSTGAMQTALVYPGSVDQNVGPAPEQQASAIREQANRQLKESYLDPNISNLIESNGYGGILFGNSLYSVDGIAEQLKDVVSTHYQVYRSISPRKRAYVGLVNLDRNEFYVADLKAMADGAVGPDGAQHAKACISQAILGSSAIPIGFPPRFIEGEMFVDGGARAALFGTILLTNKRVADRLQARHLKPYFSIIINGNQSANGYGNSGIQKTENKFLAIAKATSKNLIDQLYRDSAYRNEHDLKEVFGDDGYLSRYTYVSNDVVRDSTHEECKRAVKEQSENDFDATFMTCLYKIGYDVGVDQPTAWKDYSTIPAAPPF